MTTDLRTALAERLDAAEPPPPDLARVLHDGTTLRRRRRAVVAGASGLGLVVAAGSVGLATLGGGSDGTGIDESAYASLGALDFSHGVRAYADPGNEIHLGGRTFPADDLGWLDTDAVATPYGIVFFDEGRPGLLRETGNVVSLDDTAQKAPGGFHPTAKADVTGDLAAWATWREGVATITVRDMATGKDVATVDVECSNTECTDVVIDGIDGGAVFVRDAEGTRIWDSATGDWTDFAGPETRVADVRNGVVLYDGPAPTTPGDWQPAAGSIDAQLSHDGRHVLDWSSTLEPVDPRDDPIVLEQGPADGMGAAWWTFDTDGSVLVVTGKNYGDFTVYDCKLPSGACVAVGPLRTTSGDPEFIGNDM
ncbi:hypothetical protein HNR19_003007 [Nocardioides thalensis]|uniref:WD40 repeat domain-containing protein n=1 Tax=Nocardioides thalensis TaxID=1914755 RepID=A0A853C4V3_9ACTN|nr:hypothetical protein [Nocardioides thalensis]NYJ02309.1 hypothetical protein [Nocardioides thalensis]